MAKRDFDVVIVGGGVMGCSVAFHLMQLDSKLKLAVIEKDPTYERASTTLSVGNVRILFNLKENVQISQYAFEVFERFKEEMAVNGNEPNVKLRGEGNLDLIRKNERKEAETSLALRKSLGCEVDWWTRDKIKEKFPLFNVEGIEGGIFGYRDGIVEPYSVLMGFKAKAKSLGTEFVTDEVVEIERQDNHVSGVKLKFGDRIHAKRIVNCAGAWCSKLAESVGVKIPVVPVKRQLFLFDPKIKSKELIHVRLPTGLYLISESGGNIICGKSMDEDPIGFDFNWDEKRFMEVLWPEFAEYIPEWEILKLIRGWAGLYAVNQLDGNAILGEWPELDGFYLCNGFSGHGFQQGPAVGRYIAELLLGKTHELDLSIFTPERIFENRPIRESRLI